MDDARAAGGGPLSRQGLRSGRRTASAIVLSVRSVIRFINIAAIFARRSIASDSRRPPAAMRREPSASDPRLFDGVEHLPWRAAPPARHAACCATALVVIAQGRNATLFGGAPQLRRLFGREVARRVRQAKPRRAALGRQAPAEATVPSSRPAIARQCRRGGAFEDLGRVEKFLGHAAAPHPGPSPRQAGAREPGSEIHRPPCRGRKRATGRGRSATGTGQQNYINVAF